MNVGRSANDWGGEHRGEQKGEFPFAICVVGEYQAAEEEIRATRN